MRRLLQRLWCLFNWHLEPVPKILGVRKGRKINLRIAHVCEACGKVLREEDFKK